MCAAFRDAPTTAIDRGASSAARASVDGGGAGFAVGFIDTCLPWGAAHGHRCPTRAFTILSSFGKSRARYASPSLDIRSSVGPLPRGGPSPYLVQRVHDVHAGHHLRGDAEAHRVEAPVVPEIDEQLRGARVGAAGRERQRAPHVAAPYGVVGEAPVAPQPAQRGVARQSELHDEVRDGAEEAHAVVVPVVHQPVQAVGAPRRPVAVHLQVEGAARGGDAHDEAVGTRGVESPGVRAR